MGNSDDKDFRTKTYEMDSHGGLALERPPLTIAEERELRDLASNHAVCGHCKYFEHDEGQARMTMLRFLETLTEDQGWQVRHLATNPEHLGMCGAYDSGSGGDHTLTGMLHKACDQFRPNKGLISLRKKGKF